MNSNALLISRDGAEPTVFGIAFLTRRRTFLLLALFFFAVLGYTGMKFAQATTANFTQRTCLGAACSEDFIEDLSNDDVAIDSNGNVWSVSQNENAVTKYDPNGRQLLTLGSQDRDSYGAPESGSGTGEFNSPSSISIDGTNNIFIFDAGNNRVQKFSADGTFLTQFGSYGGNDGQFDAYGDIATDSYGALFLLDKSNNRVQKFSADGTYQGKFGSYGTGDGQFVSPYSMDVDSSGAIWVIDEYYGSYDYTRTLTKFNSDGSFNRKVTLGTQGENYIGTITGIAINKSSNNVYLLDDQENKLITYDAYGVFLSQLDVAGSYYGRPGIDNSGNIYLPDKYDTSIYKYSSGGVLQKNLLDLDVKLTSNIGVSMNAYGEIAAVDAHYDRNIITVFDEDDEYSFEIGERGSYTSYEGELGSDLFAVSHDSYGNIFVSDAANSRILKFSNTGQYLDEITFDYGGDRVMISSIAIADDGTVYVSEVVDSYGMTSRIRIVDSTNTTQNTFGSYGNDPGQMTYNYGISIASNGNVFVPNMMGGAVNIFSSQGSYIGQLQAPTTPATNPFSPSAIDIDTDGTLYVTDMMNSRIIKYNSDLTYSSEYAFVGKREGDAPGTLSVKNGKLAISIINMNNSPGYILVLDDEDSTLAGTTTTTTTTTSSTTTTTTAPTTSTTSPDTSTDDDGDNTTNYIENNGPNNGDSNNDGTPDSEQENITTFVSPATGKYVTVGAPAGVNVTQVAGVSSSSLPNTDTGLYYPGGFVHFEAETGVGDTIEVQVVFHGVTDNIADFQVRKVSVDGGTASYDTIGDADMYAVSFGGTQSIVAQYSITDGGTLDQDGVANGVIVDPVGLATQTPPTTTTTTSPGVNTPNTNNQPSGVAAASGSLPFTGSAADSIVLTATFMLFAGCALVIALRRRHKLI